MVTPSTIMTNALLVSGVVAVVVVFQRVLFRGKPVKRYAVVIDAGSSASRVLSFEFYQGKGGSVSLIKEDFYEIKEPLSKFADKPSEGAQKIKHLLDHAKKIVDEKFISQTPLVLRATAGLRLLDADKQKKLMDEVKVVVKESKFKVDDDSVGIMEGSHEGLFSWINVNFLLGTLFGDPKDMLAAWDLGGASTQITFPLVDEKERSRFSSKDVFTIQMMGYKVSVFTHSFLGYGLNVARDKILSQDKKSECVHPGNEKKLIKYGNGQEYKVSDKDSDERKESIKGCSDIIKKYIREVITEKPDKPDGILKFRIAAFSYIFDRAMDVKLINSKRGGKVTLNKFSETATQTCEKINNEKPFLCLEMLYITSLLEDGYGMKPETIIEIVKKIDGKYEVSWALGAALDILLDLKLTKPT